MKPYERIAEYDTMNFRHRCVDVDRFGRECGSSAWKPDTSKTKDIANWEMALLMVGNYRPDSRRVQDDIISYRRYL